MNSISAMPILGVAGWSGSGKTTLLEKIIPELKARGLRIIAIKHDVHGLKMERDTEGKVRDAEGTDSWRLMRAGADQVILCGPGGSDLEDALSNIAPSERRCLILVEGFKYARIPKIGICRKANGKGFTEDLSGFLAVVTDVDMRGFAFDNPIFRLDDIGKIAEFIEDFTEAYYDGFYTF
ncbi:MAG: molybdopterin-guanine dinucleotide biosynthesis protein B [Lachnospiraceae bacterium]|nr:molybdopterin-guanine dinucleotide biosynthesis protein B [Lachnospiraceae bacterium]